MHMASTSLHLRQLLIAAATAAATVLPANAASDGGAAFLERLSLNSSPSSVLVVCHGFGCAYRNSFPLTPGRLPMLRGMLGSPRSAKDDRKPLAPVRAWFHP